MSVENLITQHIDIWTSAIQNKYSAGRGSSKKLDLYGIKKLRELIFELAVRGKLVPQDPNDQPASVLLERIAKEKAKLVKDKIIKKQKALPSISENDEPYTLPIGWKWAHLQDVTTYIQRGKGPKYAELGAVKVVSQKCVQNAGFDLNPARYVDDSTLEKYQEERFLQNQDILWNSTGTGTVGRANVIDNIEKNAFVADSHVTVIRPIFSDSRFLWCFISAPGVQSRIEPDHENSLVSGSTKQVELNTSSVVSVLAPVAPLAEQSRIVKRVDELMTLCEQLEQQTEASIAAHQVLVETLLATLTNSKNAEELMENWQRISAHFDTLFTTIDAIDQLKQTILQLAVMGKLVPQNPADEPASVLLERIAKEKAQLVKDGKIKKQKALPPITDDEKPFELPDGWEWCRFSEAIDVRDGTHDSPKDAEGEDTFPLVTSKNFVNGDIDFENARRISAQDHFEIVKRSDVSKYDILFSMIGGNIGNQVMVKDDRQFSIKNVALFKYYDKELTSPDFVFLFTQNLANTLQDSASGGAQPFVSLGVLRNLLFPIPPVEEQKRIVAKIAELIEICEQLQASIKDAQTTQLHLTDAIIEQVI